MNRDANVVLQSLSDAFETEAKRLATDCQRHQWRLDDVLQIAMCLAVPLAMNAYRKLAFDGQVNPTAALEVAFGRNKRSHAALKRMEGYVSHVSLAGD